MNKLKKVSMLFLVPFLLLGASCDNNETKDQGPKVEVNETKLDYVIDIYSTTYLTIDLDETLKDSSVSGLSFTAKASGSGISVSAVNEETHEVNVFSGGLTGEYKVNVKAFVNEVEHVAYDLNIDVVDNAPAPTKIKDVTNFSLNAPVFPHEETTGVTTVIDLKEYVDASDYVTYELDSSCSNATMNVSDTQEATLSFTNFGDNNVKINVIFKDNVELSLEFTVTINKSITNQLYNGDFEQGYDGWNVNEWDRLSYAIYDSEYDIWGNLIGSNGKYLYGYANENGKVDFTSSLFTVAGSRYVTLKLAGNCTDELYISLMKYVEGGDDVEIAKYNNWFYAVSAASGFIFRDYYFVIPEEYLNEQCYFKVHDNEDGGVQGGFGFINIDQITTYYEDEPQGLEDMYKAGFKVDPDPTLVLDMSDTSGNAFTTTDVPYQLKNGDFEQGYDHWFMSTSDKANYDVIKSKTDIWSNPVNNKGYYLYGYKNEAGTATFHSDLFKVGGSGYMTFKIAGNNTSDLQFRLKKYVAEGEDVEIAKFNNTYFANGTKNHSGFIFHDYYYQIDLATYEDALCYFEVYDARTSDFGFICLDEIVTYYEQAPNLDGYLKASYLTEAI